MNHKILNKDSLQGLLPLLRENKTQLVFTNGCFDILHPGHCDYLARAKSLGDSLIVGVNSDDSIKRLKGENRPINPLNDRLIMLAALECVDFVIAFSEDTPLQLIEIINPNILVKGGDYKKEEIVGAEHVESCGGHVNIIPFLEGYSTSALIEKIKTS